MQVGSRRHRAARGHRRGVPVAGGHPAVRPTLAQLSQCSEPRTTRANPRGRQQLLHELQPVASGGGSTPRGARPRHAQDARRARTLCTSCSCARTRRRRWSGASSTCARGRFSCRRGRNRSSTRRASPRRTPTFRWTSCTTSFSTRSRTSSCEGARECIIATMTADVLIFV
jgi:hypothetical protein